jgi:hypothetical protein
LKSQLERELATLAQGGKILDTIVAKQGNNGNKGLGYVDKAKKKKNKKKGKGDAPNR